MNILNEDSDDSALFCKPLIQKRKASDTISLKNSKQMKLDFFAKPNKSSQDDLTQSLADNNLEEKELTTSHSKDWNLNESRSSYFQSKKTSETCPLCLKFFKTDSAYSTHMKQCAKTHKMTTKQLLEALELQKKQMQERRDIGLSSQIVAVTKKKSKKTDDKYSDSYDLALGLALSKSLSSSKTKVGSLPVSEPQQSTLKEFGLKYNYNEVQSKKKGESSKKYTLKERKTEDRQRIIVEKVAMVLLDEEEDKNLEHKNLSYSFHFQNNQLADLLSKKSDLWNLSENDEKRRWYVDGIKACLLPNEEITQKITEPEPEPADIKNEIANLNLPQEEIHKNWKKMINNSHLSDLIGKTNDGQEIHIHSLVVHVRCPQILEKDHETIFQKYNSSTVLSFLEYVYCGTLDGLVKENVESLSALADDFNFTELINVLNFLKSSLRNNSEDRVSPAPEITENVEKEQTKFVEEKDMFSEDNVIDLTANSPDKMSDSMLENESNVDKSYWSFLQHEKEKEKLNERKESIEETEILRTEETQKQDANKPEEKTSINQSRDLLRGVSDDSATRDLDVEMKNNIGSDIDCIILSSGSESQDPKENKSSPRVCSETPSPPHVDFEVPHFDPYDNFHCFSEEQFSPVALHSQSLITGDISSECLRVPEVEPKDLEDEFKEEPEMNVRYCSTPLTLRHSSKVESSVKKSLLKSKKRRSDLTRSRILRKSLGLQHKTKNASFKRKSVKKQESLSAKKELASALTNSILKELSKSSTPLSLKNFVEITPIASREEFKESDTPSPNFSRMEESLLKEQLSKYGLKKNLGKNKAKKVLRHIFEELHPLYNTKTGKLVKKVTTDTPKTKKKSKPREGSRKSAKSKNPSAKRKSKEQNLSDMSIGTLVNESSGSDFENFSETLTQTVPSNPLDLPSAFNEFLQNNISYHQKILLYEPIWLEEIQKKLKEAFKKHFKISDIMDFLDKKCITFRSEAQFKNNQKKNLKKQETLKKNKNS